MKDSWLDAILDVVIWVSVGMFLLTTAGIVYLVFTMLRGTP